MPIYLESPHPYVAGTNTYTYTHPGNPANIWVHFSSQTTVEYGYDFIQVFDQNDNSLFYSTGSYLADQWINVIGDTVKVQIEADGSGYVWGFAIDIVSNSPPLDLSSPRTLSGCINTFLNLEILTNGGTSPLVWELDEQTPLPEGLSLYSDNNYASISGEVSTPVATPLFFSITDAENNVTNIDMALIIYPSPSITTETLSNGSYLIPYYGNIEVNNPSLGIIYELTEESVLPKGMYLDMFTGEIKGIPLEAGEFPITISVTNYVFMGT